MVAERRFNSNMVRLKDNYQVIEEEDGNMFQFQYGTIKRIPILVLM